MVFVFVHDSYEGSPWIINLLEVETITVAEDGEGCKIDFKSGTSLFIIETLPEIARKMNMQAQAEQLEKRKLENEKNNKGAKHGRTKRSN